MWDEVLARFEKQAPASVMARLALEKVMPAAWIDEVFEANRQRQYPRELLFSTVVELMSLVYLGLRPSLHDARPKDGTPAGYPGRVVRQDQAHRAATASRIGSRQQRASAAHRC